MPNFRQHRNGCEIFKNICLRRDWHLAARWRKSVQGEVRWLRWDETSARGCSWFRTYWSLGLEHVRVFITSGSSSFYKCPSFQSKRERAQPLTKKLNFALLKDLTLRVFIETVECRRRLLSLWNVSMLSFCCLRPELVTVVSKERYLGLHAASFQFVLLVWVAMLMNNIHGFDYPVRMWNVPSANYVTSYLILGWIG